MTLYGEEIIDRLHEKSVLRDTSNPMAKIIDYGIGSLLGDCDSDSFFDQFFLDSASGGYLDLWGKSFGVPRKLGEADDGYRQRIILESLGHLTVPYLREVYGLTLYCYVSGFDASDNDLTSDNPYACSNHMTVASEEIQAILTKKFVIGTGLTFIGDDND